MIESEVSVSKSGGVDKQIWSPGRVESLWTSKTESSTGRSEAACPALGHELGPHGACRSGEPVKDSGSSENL